MWFNMALQFGLKAVQAGLSYSAAQKRYEAEERWREWRNKMTRIADAQNQNALTENAIQVKAQNDMKALVLRVKGMSTAANANVSAAAAGVKGRSVDDVLLASRRSVAQADFQRTEEFRTGLNDIRHKRRISSLQAVQAQDHSYNAPPSPIASLVGLAGQGLNLFTRAQEVERTQASSGPSGFLAPTAGAGFQFGL